MQLPHKRALPRLRLPASLNCIDGQDFLISLRAPTRCVWLSSRHYPRPRVFAHMDLGPPVKHGSPMQIPAVDRVTPLCVKRAMVHTDPADARQCLVLAQGPQRPPFFELRIAVPLAGLDAPQPAAGGLPQRQQQMRMVIVGMIAFGGHRRVDCNIGHHTLAYKGFVDEA